MKYPEKTKPWRVGVAAEKAPILLFGMHEEVDEEPVNHNLQWWEGLRTVLLYKRDALRKRLEKERGMKNVGNIKALMVDNLKRLWRCEDVLEHMRRDNARRRHGHGKL